MCSDFRPGNSLRKQNLSDAPTYLTLEIHIIPLEIQKNLIIQETGYPARVPVRLRILVQIPDIALLVIGKPVKYNELQTRLALETYQVLHLIQMILHVVGRI